MELAVRTIDGAEAGKISVSDAIFGLEPRQDILARMVRWQLAKRRAGTHDVKNRAEIWRTGKKLVKQKGSGGARHGSARVPQYRGGGRAFGPTPRDHSHDLPKQVRAMALKHALSAKIKASELVVIEAAEVAEPKTKALVERFGKLGFGNVLVIAGGEVQENFARAARNIPNVDVLPVQGINVYDILRREKLVLTRAAIEALEARFQ